MSIATSYFSSPLHLFSFRLLFVDILADVFVRALVLQRLFLNLLLVNFNNNVNLVLLVVVSLL